MVSGDAYGGSNPPTSTLLLSHGRILPEAEMKYPVDFTGVAVPIFATGIWELSPVAERLTVNQRVTGSNPVVPAPLYGGRNEILTPSELSQGAKRQP